MKRPYKMQTIRYYLLQSFLICCMGLCLYGAYSIVERNLKQAIIQNEK